MKKKLALIITEPRYNIVSPSKQLLISSFSQSLISLQSLGGFPSPYKGNIKLNRFILER